MTEPPATGPDPIHWTLNASGFVPDAETEQALTAALAKCLAVPRWGVINSHYDGQTSGTVHVFDPADPHGWGWDLPAAEQEPAPGTIAGYKVGDKVHDPSEVAVLRRTDMPGPLDDGEGPPGAEGSA